MAAQWLSEQASMASIVNLHNSMEERERALSSFLQDVAEHVCEIAGYDCALILVHQGAPERLTIRGSANLSDDFVHRWNTSDWLMVTDSPHVVASVRAFREGRTVPVTDTLRDRGFTPPWVHESEMEGYRSLLATPMSVGDRRVGAMTALKRAPHEFTDVDVRFLESVAALATQAVESGRVAQVVANSLDAFRRASELHRTLVQAAAVDQVISLLADAIGTWVELVDADARPWPPGSVRELGPAPQHLTAKSRAVLRGKLRGTSWRAGYVPNFDTASTPMSAAVAVPDPVLGTGFIVAGPDGRMSVEAITLSLQEAALIVRRILDEQRRLRIAHAEREGELVESLIHGFFRSTERQLERAGELGFDLTRSHVVVLVDSADANPSREEARRWRESLDELSTSRSALVLAGPHQRLSAVLIVPLADDSADPAESWWQRMRRLPPRKPLLVAAGNAAPAAELMRSYEEAHRAMSVLSALGSRDGRLWYPNAGLLGVLASASDTVVLRKFSDDLIEPLQAYDRRNQGHLVDTLREYVRQGQNVRRTAEAEFVHVNTVYYRLRRIEAITGLRLDEPSSRLQFEIALMVRDLEGPRLWL
jgi:purine catabolism regulator